MPVVVLGLKTGMLDYLDEVNVRGLDEFAIATKHRRNIPKGIAMSITTVFTNNRSQAVRLPDDARLPEGVKKVLVSVRGMDRIISPVGSSWDSFFLNGPQASDDFMVEQLTLRAPLANSGQEGSSGDGLDEKGQDEGAVG
jgi:antitoxin VapB